MSRDRQKWPVGEKYCIIGTLARITLHLGQSYVCCEAEAIYAYSDPQTKPRDHDPPW